MKNYPILLLVSITILSCSFATAQQVTGFWKGKIDRKNVELKIIKNGDSIIGTSYYYSFANSYRRYSIKGYFDNRDNSVVWWDDQLIAEKNSNLLFAVKSATPYLSTADFNCPGGTKMYLNGTAALRENADEEKGTVELTKMDGHTFNDEWDFVIDNYTFGTNDPELIDSIGKIAFTKPIPVEPIVVKQTPPKQTEKDRAIQFKKPAPVATPKEPLTQPQQTFTKELVVATIPLNNQQKFTTRRKQLVEEIPVSGDSIELKFYDNAEVDGDSIAIFLNDRLLYEHVLLSDKGYSIILAVAALQQSNELVMVAENQGSIPPNTSLMVAMVDGKRYETRLESTEQSSAVIRFVKKEL